MTTSQPTLNSLIIKADYPTRTLECLMRDFGYDSLDEVNADKVLASTLAFLDDQNLQVSKALYDILNHFRAHPR